MLLHPCISEGSVCCSIWYAWLYLLHIIQNNWYLRVRAERLGELSTCNGISYIRRLGPNHSVCMTHACFSFCWGIDHAFYSQLWSSNVLWRGSRLAYFSELYNLLPTWNWETLANGCFCCSLMMTEAFMFAKHFQFQERVFFPFMLVSVEKPANFQRQRGHTEHFLLLSTSYPFLSGSYPFSVTYIVNWYRQKTECVYKLNVYRLAIY